MTRKKRAEPVAVEVEIGHSHSSMGCSVYFQILKAPVDIGPGSPAYGVPMGAFGLGEEKGRRYQLTAVEIEGSKPYRGKNCNPYQPWCSPCQHHHHGRGLPCTTNGCKCRRRPGGN